MGNIKAGEDAIDGNQIGDESCDPQGADCAVQASAMFAMKRDLGSSLFISLSVLVLLRTSAENYAGLKVSLSECSLVRT